MTHQPRPAFFATSGPLRPRIVLLGEAWGESEEKCFKPFSGESGKELWRMLGEAMPEIEPELHREICEQHKYGLAWIKDRERWLAAAGVAFTNVLAFRPPGNKLEELCGAKKDVGEVAGALPALARGKYLREEFLPELDRLGTELRELAPNLILALGNTACWALLGATNIGSIRGAITAVSGPTFGREGRVVKCLPTYHPAGVLRQWAWRPIVVADLMKAHREANYAEIRRPSRQILCSPSIEETERWEQETYSLNPAFLASDTETEAGQITKISFARSASEALVIPFWDRTVAGYSYWPTPALERRAWDVAERLLTADIPLIWQNGLYDLQYITKMGIRPTRCEADTMLLHHSMFPELQKGLGFLGSIYTNESNWKLMRKRKADSEKKDE